MRVLIDECINQRIRLEFAAHDCQTVAYAGFAGLKNGAMLRAAEAAGFEVLITTDQEISFQQNLAQRRIAVVVLCASTNRLEDLLPLIPEALRALDTAIAGGGVRISAATGSESG